jgi:hypothetical protein
MAWFDELAKRKRQVMAEEERAVGAKEEEEGESRLCRAEMLGHLEREVRRAVAALSESLEPMACVRHDDVLTIETARDRSGWDEPAKVVVQQDIDSRHDLWVHYEPSSKFRESQRKYAWDGRMFRSKRFCNGARGFMGKDGPPLSAEELAEDILTDWVMQLPR